VVTPGLVRLAHARGQQVHVWTVDGPRRCTGCWTWAVDGLMTDDIVTLRDVLRAPWPVAGVDASDAGP
jgi:glycerophosphoryl diester phosphodiesterase